MICFNSGLSFVVLLICPAVKQLIRIIYQLIDLSTKQIFFSYCFELYRVLIVQCMVLDISHKLFS